MPAASDDFFAEKENLIRDAEPVFLPDKYTDRGKWMDGWESRRKRTPGHDWAVLRLGISGVIHGVVIDTSFFTGNYPEYASLDGCEAPADSTEELRDWTELLTKSPLQGDTRNAFAIVSPRRFTHVRLNIFADGGVARLRVYGVALPEWQRCGSDIDLAAAECGAVIVEASDKHYGHPRNLIMPGIARDMRDGWETRRRRGPGHDWVILRLAGEGVIDRVEVDTSHFKGNYPDRCSLDLSDTGADGSWREVLPPTKLQADTRRVFREELTPAGPARFSRFHIYPDGGVSRLRLFGRLTVTGRAETSLAALNAAADDIARRELLRCCGSRAWAAQMAAARPFSTLAGFEQTADRIWAACAPQDHVEALAAHPRIGERSGGNWSNQEQAGARAAADGTLTALADANRRYEEKFGHRFIVCATGKTADEMLGLLQERLGNDAQAELRNAIEQQRLITGLRLRKLLTE